MSFPIEHAENGINGATGEYLFPSLNETRQLATNPLASQLAEQARSSLANSYRNPHLNELQNRAELRQQAKGVAYGVDATKLAQTGWGVIFAEDYPTAAYNHEALLSGDGLGLLLKHRQAQATQENEKYYRQCIYKPGQDKAKFLKAHRVPTSGPVDPDRGMPYYLLIVGDPATIPYEFQYQLDVQYAVGRIYFDKLSDYAHYAQSVVRAETEQLQRSKTIQFWGVSNKCDAATQLSAKSLINPLNDWATKEQSDWNSNLLIGETATKANLDRIFNQSDSKPALLLTASHGVGYPIGDPRQRDYQGALVTQDWLRSDGAPDPEQHLFAAADIQANADIHGLIAFHFACYGLGTPQRNNFQQRDNETVGKALAEQPLISKLPQALLSHEKGGALAVIGHVDRAFSDSFKFRRQEQLNNFESLLACLMKQCPVGYALEFFNQQYAELAAACMDGIQNGDKGPSDLAKLWTTSTNARNYAIFGDPAVRAAIAPPETPLKKKPLVWLTKPSPASTQRNSPRNKPMMTKPMANGSSENETTDSEQGAIAALLARIQALEQRVEKLERERE